MRFTLALKFVEWTPKIAVSRAVHGPARKIEKRGGYQVSRDPKNLAAILEKKIIENYMDFRCNTIKK